MKDDQIKKIVKANSEKYEIKTTSQDILNAYEAKTIEKENHTPWYKAKWFTIGLPTLVLSAGIVVAIVLPTINNGNNPIVIVPNEEVNIVTNNSRKSQNAFSVFSGMEIINEVALKDDVTPLSALRNSYNPYNRVDNEIFYSSDDNENDNDDEEEDDDEEDLDISTITFNNIVDIFDPSVNTLISFFDENNKIETSITKGKFKGEFGEYEYKQEIKNDNENYIFLTNVSLEEENKEDEKETETTYNGEIVYNNVTYKVESNIENSVEVEGQETESEDEIKTTIYYKTNSTLVIEQENEVTTSGEHERSYVYSLNENDELIYQETISFESEEGNKDQTLTLEIIDQEVEYVFENIVYTKENNNLILTSDVNVEDEYFDTLKLIENNQVRVYENSKGEKITK